jgi:hypothetical protein
MRYHYVWLLWSLAFLGLWGVLFLANPGKRRAMWHTSLVTALFGLTEPLFVPRYWNPPSLFELAQRTGFDIESFIFAFAVGGIGMLLYTTLTRREHVPLGAEERREQRHRFHRLALIGPLVLLVPGFLLPWNPIYPSLLALALGALAAVVCRPDLTRNTLVGAVLFLGLYALFMLGLRWLVPGYIAAVWNLPALCGGLVYGIPLEELLFGLAFGMYWSGVYEHVTWHASGARMLKATHGGSPR